MAITYKFLYKLSPSRQKPFVSRETNQRVLVCQKVGMIWASIAVLEKDKHVVTVFCNLQLYLTL